VSTPKRKAKHAPTKTPRSVGREPVSPARAIRSDDSRSTPPRGLVVGIGASTGGLDAFRTFFDHMPVNPGMTFVLVQHLDPNHASMLVDLLGQHSRMKVLEAKDGMQLAPDHVFVIPPNASLEISDGALRVSRPAPPREHRRPVDTFFTSLATDQRERAVCIVLSGMGSDGTLGLRRIKEHGGLSLAQAESDATAMPGMPQSAAATGLVDHIVPVAAMPALLIEYQQHLQRNRPGQSAAATGAALATHLPAIYDLLRAGTGHDFSEYKHSTLERRIERRMQVLRIATPGQFVTRLRHDPQQVDLLFREFLISVTQFFRDPLAFDALQTHVIEPLLTRKRPGDSLRIWVPACATGEEVYSIAILVREAVLRHGLNLKVQIFGTDIDDAAVAIARAGRYSKNLTGVSAERLERWFVTDGEEFYPLREIREMCIFSTHSIVKDPPFSRLDFISCRNLLIYLEADLQDRLTQTFHYALSPDGYLSLGQSEGITRKTKLFATVDKKQRIFQRREVSAAPGLPPMTHEVHARVPASDIGRRLPEVLDATEAELRSVVERHSPAYVVIDQNHEIVRFSGGDVRRYLEPSPGTATLDLFMIVRKGLRATLRRAVERARKTQSAVTTDPMSISIDGKTRALRAIVEPVIRAGGKPTRWVVIFEDTIPPRSGKPARESRGKTRAQMQALELDLLTTRTQLRTTIDQLESSNEEMRSANEEYQSVNEELQSSNEELETAKEELQSINEELQTVNAEMLGKNDALVRLSSDLKNLLDNTQVATLFLDRELSVTYFTPTMTDLFHLRDSDRGRPVTEIVARMHYPELRRDVANVLSSLVGLEREVHREENDAFFLMRIEPYRSVDDVIEGVVITFIDITERKRYEQTRAQLAAIVDSSADAIIGHAFDGTITSWNAGAEAIFGYGSREAIGQPFSILIPTQSADAVPGMLDQVKRGERIAHFEINRVRKDGKVIDVSLTVSPVLDRHGTIVAASTIAREFTERKLAEDHRNLLMGELDHRVKNTLMVVITLIAQTARHVATPAEFTKIIEGRVLALSRVHSLLNRETRGHAELHDLVHGELAAYRLRNDDRVVVASRDRIHLTARATQSLAMAVHELATNAAKYGALSSATGTVDISWDVVDGNDERQLRILWLERDGPAVPTPTRRGFGSELIERVLGYELQARVDRQFLTSGVRCTIEFPLTASVGYQLPSTTNAAQHT
jgi:two-component system CheB/CheR fusion protein